MDEALQQLDLLLHELVCRYVWRIVVPDGLARVQLSLQLIDVLLQFVIVALIVHDLIVVGLGGSVLGCSKLPTGSALNLAFFFVVIVHVLHKLFKLALFIARKAIIIHLSL